MVAVATVEFDYLRRRRDYTLVRRASSGGSVERLVNGRWVAVGQPRSLEDPEVWQRLDAGDLRLHARRYLVLDFAAAALAWQEDRVECFRRMALGRWLVPPLKGGASKRLGPGTADRSRSAYAELLSEVHGEDLDELKEEARLGYEHQRQRGGSTEQRANFFLGAAGLTTSLVLANAGLLLGTSKLDPTWRGLAAIALGAASICAIAAGLRAMQATMITFWRTPPNAVPLVVDRRELSGEDLARSYVAALLVAQGRAGVIGDWKVARLAAARRWFIGAIGGVVLLTAFVLIEAL
jgi:hypothetical protein